MFYSFRFQRLRSRAANILPVFAVALLASCSAAGDSPTSPGGPPPTSGTGPAALVDMSTPAVALGGIGSTETISATIRDASGRVLTSPSVTWTSESPTIAEVAGNGVSAILIARAPGVTRVRAASGNAAAYVDVRVLGVRALTITPAALSVRLGDPQPLRASIDGDAGAAQSVKWSTLNPSIATVDASGLVTGVGLGVTTVRASATADPSIIATANITVMPARTVSFAPGTGAVTLWVGDKKSVDPVVDVDSTQTRDLVWTSENVAVATVDATGTITAIATGTTIIHATSIADPRAKGDLLVTVLAARAVTVTPNSLSLGTQQRGQLNANVTIDNGLSSAVTWSTSDPSVVTVSGTGQVTGIVPGVAVITATSVGDPTRSGTSVVTVTPSIRSVDVSPNAVASYVGDQDQLVADVVTDGPLPRTVTWRSSNPSIASVSSTGIVYSMAVGQATITALSTVDTTMRGSAQITVSPAPLVGVSPSSVSLTIGELRTLTPHVTVAPGVTSAVNWRSSAPSVASVNSGGVVQGEGVGTAVITMISIADTTRRATSTITVVPIVRSVTITPANASGFVGDVIALSATVVADGTLARTVTWRTSNSAVATVSASGNATLLSNGSATITAISTADTTKRATAQITVGTPSVQSVTLTPSTASIFVAQSVQLNTVVTAGGSLPTTYTIRSSNSAVATVGSTGLVTGIAAGSATITAISTADTTKRATAQITVTAPSVQSVTLTPSNAGIFIGQSTQLNAVVTAGGSLPTTYTLRTSNAAVATVNTTGLVTAISAGSTTITAISVADTTKRATATVTVASRPVTVSIAPRPITLSPNQTQQLNATVLGDPGISTSVTWSSSSPATATISGAGLVTAVASGSALITAVSSADPTKQDTVTVTVSNTQLATSWSTSRLGGALYEDVLSTVGFGANAAFAVNVVGDVYRWDGSNWTLSVRGSTYGGQFLAVHGSSASNVIAVGTSGITARFDGSSWTSMSSGTTQVLTDVWVEGVGAAYAVGANGTALRLSGSSWVATSTGSVQTLNGVWSIAGTVFAVGNAGEVLRYNGSAWSHFTTPTSETLYGVAGTSASSVVAVGTVGTIMRFDGTSWTVVSNGVTSADLYAVSGSSANGGRMYIASDAGLLQLDASSITVPTTPYRPRLYAVSVDAAGTVWTGGQRGSAMRYVSGTWTTTSLAPDLLDVSTTSASSAWAVGEFGFIYRWNGSSWSRQPTPTTLTLNTVWGASASDAFAGGESGTMLRFNGSSWTTMSIPTTATVTSIWGSSSSDVYATTSSGQVLRFNGSAWTISATTANPLWGIYGLASGEVYATGENGTLLRYNGSGWTSSSPTANGVLVGMWGSSSNNLLTVGVDASGSIGVAYRFNGSSWASQSMGTSRVLTSVWGPASSDVYVTGEQGTMLRYNGTSWQAMSTGTTDLLWSVSGSPNGAGGAFAVGYNSTLVTGTGPGSLIASAMRSGAVRTSLEPSAAARLDQRKHAPLPDGAARRFRKGAARAVAARVAAATVPAPASIKFRLRGTK